MNFINNYIRSMKGYKWGEQPRPSPQVIKLNSNENPYDFPLTVAEIQKSIDYNRLKHYPDPLSSELRQKAAEYHKVSPEQIVFANGSDELISIIFRTFLNRDENVLLTEHTYSHYKTYAEALGIPCSTMPMNGWNIDLEVLNKMRTKVFFLTNPNAPTGISLKIKYIEYYIKRHDSKLFVVDEAYAQFSLESCISLVRKYPNLIVLRTMSKSWSLAGLRIGYAIANKELIAAMNKVRDPFNLNYYSQQLGILAFEHSDKLELNIQKVISTREHFVNHLKQLGFIVLPSRSNFVMCSFPNISGEIIYQTLKEKEIYIRFFNKPKLEDYVRISIGTDRQMQILLEELKKIINTTV